MTLCLARQCQSQQDWALQILVASLYECKWKDDKNVGFCLSLQGSRAEPLPLFTLPAWLSTTLDIVGISLALLDFTGASRKIEAALARFRDWEREFADYARVERSSIRDLKKQRREFLDTTWRTAIGLSIAGAIAYRFGDFSRLDPYLPNWPEWAWWSLLMAAPLLWVLYYIINHIVSLTIGAWISDIVWRFFWLLSRPKAGVLGTIGLALTFFDTALSLIG